MGVELYITFIHLVQISFYGSTMAQWLSPWPHRENVLGYPLCGSKVPISVIGCLWWCQSCEGLETSRGYPPIAPVKAGTGYSSATVLQRIMDG